MKRRSHHALFMVQSHQKTTFLAPLVTTLHSQKLEKIKYTQFFYMMPILWTDFDFINFKPTLVHVSTCKKV